MATNKIRRILFGIALLILVAGGLYFVPPIHDRLSWRLAVWSAEIRYWFNPPEDAVFIPEDELALIVQATFQALTPSPSDNNDGDDGSVPKPTRDPFLPTFTPQSTTAPLPDKVILEDVAHEFQRWNNCGPATLSMGLKYWGWTGSQSNTATYLKPNARDKNVMPYELTAYIAEETGYNAMLRVGGDLDLLKILVANGYPILVEKGFTGPGFNGWMAHYELITGYDDLEGKFIAQDSFNGPDFEIDYEKFEFDWQNINYTFIIIYPESEQDTIYTLIGDWRDPDWAVSHAATKSEQQIVGVLGEWALDPWALRYDMVTFSDGSLEATYTDIPSLSGITDHEALLLFFALYNQGSNYIGVFDYYSAALSYDNAFRLYELLPEDVRPWRMMWYQTGPYWAYFYTGRYNDVINLSTTTLTVMDEPVLEESFYWRGQAYEALGGDDYLELAIEDYRQSIRLNNNFGPGYAALSQLNVSP